MAGQKEVIMSNNNFGDNQNTSINFGTDERDQRRIEFLKAVHDEDLTQIKILLLVLPDIFDSDYKIKSIGFACEENKLSAGKYLWQKWKTDLMPLLEINGVVNEKLLGAMCSLKQRQDDVLPNKYFTRTSLHSVQSNILLNAIKRGNEEMFKGAIMSGANPYLAAEDGQLLIDMARSKRFENLCEYTDLCNAVGDGNILMTQAMLMRGDDINQKGENNNTPLHVAVNKGNMAIFALLLQHGADVNKGNSYNSTPLHRAVFHYNIEAAQLLIEQGAAVDCQDNDGSTPLHEAITGISEVVLDEYFRNINPEIFCTLFKAGAAVNIKDASGKTPLDSALKWMKLCEISTYLSTTSSRTTPMRTTGIQEYRICCALEKIIPLLKSHGAVSTHSERQCIIQ